MIIDHKRWHVVFMLETLGSQRNLKVSEAISEMKKKKK